MPAGENNGLGPSGPSGPNIVLIVVDQQHPGCLGYAGHPVVRTPHLDALAHSGVTFSRAYVANPLCMPSRASVFTGLMPRGHRTRMNGIGLDPVVPTFTEALRRAGYRTHAAGKLHFGTSGTPHGVPLDEVDPQRFPEARALWHSGRVRDVPLPFYGFASVDYIGGHGHGSWGHHAQWLDREHPAQAHLFRDAVPLEPPTPARGLYNRQSYKWALPEELHPMRWIADRAVDFLDGAGQRRQEPFFLFVSFQDPHPPFAPPAPWCFMHEPNDVPPPLRREGEFDVLPPHFRLQYETALETQGNKGQPMKETEPYRAECAAHYYGLIEMVDQQVGRVLEALRRNGLEEDTVVVFTADHGEALGDHGMWGKGPYHYDSVIRVPLLARWPGRFRRGAAHTGVVSLIDLAPTLLDLAGVPVPAVPALEAPHAPPAWPGRSLRPILETGESDTTSSALVEEDEDYLGFRMRTLVTERYRLTAYSRQPYGELFDLEEDPHEYRNLWHDRGHLALRQELQVALLDKIMKTDLALPRQTSRS
ncbi:MAG: sulfatase-like hydrolase/transferase [Chloroflexi bacterium]|nr:sulfatase-like hydrolase/transferase [Chloroflexota bacterium]